MSLENHLCNHHVLVLIDIIYYWLKWFTLINKFFLCCFKYPKLLYSKLYLELFSIIISYAILNYFTLNYFKLFYSKLLLIKQFAPYTQCTFI